MSTHTSKVEHQVKGAAAETKKVEAEGHKHHPATSDHSIKTPSSKTSMKTTTKDGTTISVKGAGPEIPSMVSPPSNKQIDSVLSGAHHDLESEKPHLDLHGQAIASSTQNVLDASSLLLNEKNKQERFQKLFLFTQGTAKGGPSEGVVSATKNLMTEATGMGSKISNDATDVISYIRETVFNLTTSGEFRRLTIQFLDLLQSLMGQLKTAIAQTDANQPLKASRIRSQVYETEQDRLDDINEKLAVFLKRVGKNPQYRAVINNFMKYSEEIYDALYQVKAESSGTKEAGILRKTLDEAWEILNDFVGDNKLVPKFKKNLQGMLEKISKDQELTSWMKDFKSLLTNLMEHPEVASKYRKRTSKLIKSGGDLTDKYRNDLDRLYSQVRRIVDRIQSDPVILNFHQQLEKLGRDIALNNKGQPDLFVLQKSMNVIRDLLIERFRKVLVDVPIERVHIKNDSMEVTLKNISVQGHGLVPNNLRVEMSSISVFNFERSSDAAQKFRIHLRVDQIRPHFEGVQFNYKKTSFPSIKDKGIADVIFEGDGLSVDVAIQFAIASNSISKARLENCTVNVDTVNLKIEEAKHDLLGAIFAPMIQSRIKAKFQAGTYEFVHGRVRQLIDQLNRWFQTKPFETLMVTGNESIQTAMEKKDEQKSKRKLSEAKKELTAEEKQKKKEKKLQQQKDQTSVKLDETHRKHDQQQYQQHGQHQQPHVADMINNIQQHSGVGHQQPHVSGQQYQQHSDVGHQHHHSDQHLNNPNVTKSGLPTQEHFVHPADYQAAPTQHQQHYPNDAGLGHQQQPDRITKMLDPNFVNPVKEQPST